MAITRLPCLLLRAVGSVRVAASRLWTGRRAVESARQIRCWRIHKLERATDEREVCQGGPIDQVCGGLEGEHLPIDQSTPIGIHRWRAIVK